LTVLLAGGASRASTGQHAAWHRGRLARFRVAARSGARTRAWWRLPPEGYAEIFRAFFERGEDIGDKEVLMALALELGMDGNSLNRALEVHEFEPSVLADEREAQNLGVRAIPAFVASRKAALSGVQPKDNLLKLVDSTLLSRADSKQRSQGKSTS
jgi:predicted DsbA family dithiol-disulfide isomerase